MSSRNPWRELERLLHVEEPELMGHIEALGPELGLATDQLGRLRRLDSEQLASHLRCLVGQRRAEGQAVRARLAERRAQVAAHKLVQQALFDSGVVMLNVGVLLGDILVHPSAKYIGLQIGEHVPLHIQKRKLRQVSRALRPFDDVRCYLDEHALHLRWRGGRGGLDLIGRRLSWNDKDSTFQLVFTNKPRVERPTSSTRRRAPSGAWLNEILGDLGFPL